MRAEKLTTPKNDILSYKLANIKIENNNKFRMTNTDLKMKKEKIKFVTLDKVRQN